MSSLQQRRIPWHATCIRGMQPHERNQNRTSNAVGLRSFLFAGGFQGLGRVMPIGWPFGGRSELKKRARENSIEAVFRNKLPLLASRSLGTATPDWGEFFHDCL